MSLNPDLGFALHLADVADELAMARFRTADLVVETKPDLTPVTEADRAVEEALRRRIGIERPGHAVLGEEMGGGDDGPSEWQWVLDPIDGTKNYLRGVPVWATLIALRHEGEGVLGVVSAPALGRRWWAARGEGAWAAAPGGDPVRARVSAVTEVHDAFLSYDSAAGFEEHGIGPPFLGLVRRCWRTRGYGDFWSHVLVAEGAVDIAVEPEVAVWDVAPLQVIVEEAGGRFTDLAGRARADGGSAVSTNGALHDQSLAALAGSG